MQIDQNRLRRIDANFKEKNAAARDAMRRMQSLRADSRRLAVALGEIETGDPTVDHARKLEGNERDRAIVQKAEIDAALTIATAEFEIAEQERDRAGALAREAKEFAAKHGSLPDDMRGAL